MSSSSVISVKCPDCSVQSNATVYSSINVTENPELKAGVMDGSLFVHECPHCGAKTLLNSPVAYIDPAGKFIIFHFVGDVALSAPEEGEFAGFTIRHVREIGELIEKVKIFDAGLDDQVLELCKNVTTMEMKREVPLKFLKLNGADNEIIFTYPEKGQMEMIAIGFNVYEDCSSIIAEHRR